MKTWTKESLKELLQEKVLTIVFEKIDGTERTMVCTLLPHYLPKIAVIGEEKVRTESPDVIRTWDVDKEDWRSFRVSSVKSVV